MARAEILVAVLTFTVIGQAAQIPSVLLGTPSCTGRCGEDGDIRATCRCNPACIQYGDCCQDYATMCPAAFLAGVTDKELNDLSEQLWAIDENRLSNDHVQVRPRGGKKFFQYVRESELEKGTYAALIKVLDDYNPVLGVAEPTCSQCVERRHQFLKAAMDTKPMQRLWEFLSARGLASSSENGFTDELFNYWFQLYSRSHGPLLDSSGFEHVFAGEIKPSSTVSGFHNWVKFYREEKKGELVYDGYITGCDPKLHVTKFYWDGHYKSIGSLFVSTSPEFELAVYTLCFVARPNGKCHVSLAGKKRTITTYIMNGISPKAVGTAYPDC